MEAIRVEHLTKTYGNITAVNNLSLTIHQGELFSLLGVNGAGKTTTIKMLSCLTQPSGGNAWINGKSILNDTASVKEMIAVSPQETAVAPALTVRENLEMICGIYGFSHRKRAERVAELIELLGLKDIIHRKAGKLSGGWQRRLSIAMALISEPKVLFLDEPTLGLDVIARRDLWDLIRSLKGRITMILTTHYMEESEALSDRIAIMKDGRLLLCGTAQEIKQKADTENFEEAFIRIVRGEVK